MSTADGPLMLRSFDSQNGRFVPSRAARARRELPLPNAFQLFDLYIKWADRRATYYACKGSVWHRRKL